jgi:hypothetical protein
MLGIDFLHITELGLIIVHVLDQSSPRLRSSLDGVQYVTEADEVTLGRVLLSL